MGELPEQHAGMLLVGLPTPALERKLMSRQTVAARRLTCAGSHWHPPAQERSGMDSPRGYLQRR
jgi:hypothetical protein